MNQGDAWRSYFPFGWVWFWRIQTQGALKKRGFSFLRSRLRLRRVYHRLQNFRCRIRHLHQAHFFSSSRGCDSAAEGVTCHLLRNNFQFMLIWYRCEWRRSFMFCNDFFGNACRYYGPLWIWGTSRSCENTCMLMRGEVFNFGLVIRFGWWVFPFSKGTIWKNLENVNKIFK